MGKSMILVAILIGLGVSVSAQWQNVPRAVCLAFLMAGRI